MSSRVTAVAAGCLATCFIASVFTLSRIEASRPNATLQHTLYLQDPEVIRRFSLGYTGLAADIYWTRAVQYFGKQRIAKSSDLHLLYPLLKIATHLDPQLLPAYNFGAVFLAQSPPLGAARPEQAVELMRYGISKNPDSWRLYFNLGHIQYLELKDYSAAADTFERGSKVPNAHPFMAVMAARMRQEAGSYDVARTLWLNIAETTKDKQIRENALMRLKALRVDEEVTMLEELAVRYEKITGRKPTSIQDLVSAGLLRFVPRDPEGNPYRINEQGGVQIMSPELIPYITKGLPPA